MNYYTLDKYETVKEKKSHIVKQLLVVTAICAGVSIILLIILELLVALFISFAFTMLAFGFYISMWYPVHRRKCPRCNSKMKLFNDGEHEILFYCEDCKVKIKTGRTERELLDPGPPA
ncbi:hypothetical protein [Treponema sp. J25]|uniref:hypothetical protein n=1 Tax=Treponema sp. J25 TaxID=2094121 RepID=UPI00104E24E3|nr:hypothetical protein [Treponema sp. J25]TCW60402.1 hypothetical protein C5O22_11740 [Treponema sp. J25]